jgi:hypothetical protein
MENKIVYLGDDPTVVIDACFVCKKNTGGARSSFLQVNGSRIIYTHPSCITPFVTERDRAIQKNKETCIWKACLLWPLGDCRAIIADFLLQLPNYKEVFAGMFKD